jgi:Mlc titration factor MtfA (ptsG expression regulator)
MPFDTTYNFVNSDKKTSVTVTVPAGGKDTVINLPAEQLASHGIKYPELTEQSNQPIYLQNQPEPKDDSVGFIIAVIMVVGIAYAIKKYFPGLIKSKDLRNFNVSRIVLIILAPINVLFFLFGSYAFGFMTLTIILLGLIEFKNEIFYPARVINTADEYALAESNFEAEKEPLLRYKGADLNFTDAEIESALNKRFPYYIAMNAADKERFLHRIKNFIADKIFYIHDESGFKEMPILISAAAIQLTFGFKKYLLPYFKNIHVFPEEFFRSNNMGVCFLEGNVSGNNINLSWKHFLRGYEQTTDGQNVGLHELAHALYYQTFVIGQNVDENFRDSYNLFIDHGNKVYHTEKTEAGGLYSDYAVKNFQEFWAESAEIYFERPAMLKELYPSLYETMKTLLNQDLLNENNLPVR